MSTQRVTRRRGEDGVVAVLVAVLAVVLLGIGALAVDVGRILATRDQLQSSVDLAALAAARELEDPDGCPAAAIVAAQDILEDDANQVLGQAAVNLDDGSAANGSISCSDWRVRVRGPDASVDPGLARIFTSDSVAVAMDAEARVSSPLTGILPGYAVSGCDYGPQSMIAATSGGDGSYVPVLRERTTPYAPQRLADLSPETIDLNQAPPLTIEADNVAETTFVAFTTEDGLHREYPVPGTNPIITVDEAAGTVSLNRIPFFVRSEENVWWVRLSQDLGPGPTQWTDPAEALPLTVGEPPLECEDEDTDFGVAELPHSGASGDHEIALNIITGPQVDLTTQSAVLAAQGFNVHGATDGLVAGVDGTRGRLAGVGNSEGCPGGGSGSIEVDGRRYSVNDDTLTCFFTDGVTRISDIADPGFGSGRRVRADVFDSPRFFWVPVLASPPERDTSGPYPIVDFRPAFVTGELASSRKGSRTMDPDTDNGIAVEDDGISTLKVVFFDVDALPESTADRPTMPYLGVGTKVVVLSE